MPKNVPDSILYSFEQIIITLKRTSREIAIRSRCNRRPCFLSFGVKSLRIRPMCYGCARARRCYLPNSFSYYVSDLFTRHFFYDSQTETWSLFIKYTHERVVLWRSKCSLIFYKNYFAYTVANTVLCKYGVAGWNVIRNAHKKILLRYSKFHKLDY